MMRPATSLFAKILFWSFLNLILVAAVLAAFFAFQSQVNLHAIFGQQGSNRLRTTAMLMTHELNQLPQEGWADVLSRYAAIHRVDFNLVLEDGTRFSSVKEDLPEIVRQRVLDDLRHKPPPGPPPPPPELHPSQRLSESPIPSSVDLVRTENALGRSPSPQMKAFDQKPHLSMHTRHPTRYWSGVKIMLDPDALGRPSAAILLAASASFTGNGFFFDPLPWMVVAGAVLLISVLLWIPLVRSITRPLARMTRATEEIAKGRFDISIDERRNDEIGRLAKTINRMAARLSAFVTGQKRFLGDVAHELGSPIARIQFGLGALEQRIDDENRKRVLDVMADVDHMTELVNELLAFSRAEMNSATVKLKKIALLPVVQTAVKREDTPAAEIVIQIDPGIRVIASADLLTRALTNLLRNAIKYAEGTGPIQVCAEKRGAEIALEVRDNGPGVPEAYLHRLFEPFFRPEASRDRDLGGVGLGLAIVKTCIETCNGSVFATNLKPKGFSVTIALKYQERIHKT
jgi:two-component system sensor histidine kinase CpxA